MIGQPVDVGALATRVRATAPRLGGVRLVVIDGPAGSGKTTLADLLAAELGDAPVVHMDDLYAGWSGLRADVWARLRDQVLEPLAAGRTARYQVYDWAAGRFDHWVEVSVPAVLLVEGVGSAARPVDPWASLRIWVEAPRNLRLARGVKRDGESMRSHWLRWTEDERVHFDRDGAPDRADILVDGSAPPSP